MNADLRLIDPGQLTSARLRHQYAVAARLKSQVRRDVQSRGDGGIDMGAQVVAVNAALGYRAVDQIPAPIKDEAVGGQSGNDGRDVPSIAVA